MKKMLKKIKTKEISKVEEDKKVKLFNRSKKAEDKYLDMELPNKFRATNINLLKYKKSI